MSEPENLTLKLLREIRGDVADIHQTMATKLDLADVKSEISSLRADVTSNLLRLEGRLNERFNHLNRSVIGYHSSVVGHGLLISEFEDRLRRVEEHLKLPPTESH